MSTSKEVILDAANSMVQQLRIELDSLTKERDELKIKLLEVAHLKHELAILRDTAKRRLNLLRMCVKEDQYCPYCGWLIAGLRHRDDHHRNCVLAVELKENK